MTVTGTTQVLTDGATSLSKQDLVGFLRKGGHFVTLCLKKSLESTAFATAMFVASGCGLFVGFLTYTHLVHSAKRKFQQATDLEPPQSIELSGICFSGTAGILTVAGAYTGYRRYLNPSLSSASSIIITLGMMCAAAGLAVSSK